MVTIDLTGRTILMTGALSAIAEFVCRRLIEAGAKLLLTDVVPSEAATQRLREWKLPGSQWQYAAMDVTDAPAVTATVDRLLAQHPEADIVLGHAGGCGLHPFATTPQVEFDRIFRFNFHGQTHLARAVLPNWQKRKLAGHLIFTTSLVAELPWVDVSAYNSAKAALQMFARCLALEHAADGIRFNCIAPGFVAAGSSLKVYEEDAAYRAVVDRVIPLKRRVAPESIADAFLWLCSDLARDVNGQVIKVDCGASIPKVG